MSLATHLQNIRSKPDHIRRRIALGTAFGITAIIFAFWLASFTASINSSDTVSVASKQVSTPGQALIAGVGGFFGDIKDMIFGSKKITYSEVEVSPGN